MERIVLHMPIEYVREIEYVDKSTGESKTFNCVKLPPGCYIDGMDLSGAEFNPLFVDDDPAYGNAFLQIPLRADRQVWVKAVRRDEAGEPFRSEDGRWEKVVHKIDPAILVGAILDALE